MSRIIDEMPADRRDGRRIYPWDQWTDGRIWEIERGVDFSVSAEKMAGNIRTYASRRGFNIECKPMPDETVAFRFTPKAAS